MTRISLERNLSRPFGAKRRMPAMASPPKTPALRPIAPATPSHIPAPPPHPDSPPEYLALAIGTCAARPRRKYCGHAQCLETSPWKKLPHR